MLNGNVTYKQHWLEKLQRVSEFQRLKTGIYIFQKQTTKHYLPDRAYQGQKSGHDAVILTSKQMPLLN